ncbi:uncharacterized protein LOC131291274, partial [Anopheles ziemanni]|uniref:uncharacterized protein LOC131269277 n=1 Tax=Anopheles coustani TaxID=139045 RepID=UPI002657EDDD
LQWFTLAVGVVLIATVQLSEAQRRLRPRPRVLNSAEYADSAEEQQQDSRPQAQALPQYYRAQERLGGPEGGQQLVLVAASEEDYNGQYGTPTPRARADTQQQYQRPAAKSTTVQPAAARQKAPASESRAPPVQTIRNYSKVNDDGSFTFGYEAADGSFKEETRGTDCVVRGKYGYVDPDGNKREFTYVSGNPCDPNNPDGSEEEEAADDAPEDSNENVPQNYPRRPPVARPTPAAPVRPTQAPVRQTTTVFQNDYQDRRQPSVQAPESDEQEVQIGQRGGQRPAARPFAGVPSPTPTQRPRVQVLNTTPSPTPSVLYQTSTPAQTVVPVNITPKPVYRVSPLPTQPNLAPTTYRPASPSSTRGPSIDFEAEFKRFQQDNKLPSPASAPATASTPSKPTGSPFGRPQIANGNPIYQSQLIFDPASGQYDTALYQQLPQSDGDFQLNHRIQPYVQAGPAPHPASGQLVSLEQLQQQSPLYRAQPPQPSPPVARPPPPPTVQIPQQLYQKQQNELQFVNSQQLFAQQLELQQSQLRADRLEAAKKQVAAPGPLHRFQPQPQQQQYYFIQPQGPSPGGAAPGQIDAFLRGHNIDY